MSGANPIRNILRIDNVETQAAERITANDEERQRQGFDIQTVFAWPVRDGHIDVDSAIAKDVGGSILRLDYASGASISRVNKGLRRRREKSILGFGIDPATGRWTRGPADGDEEETPEGPIKQRVVPIVQDNKNTLLLRLAASFDNESSMATLQHAMARGLEIVFELEEGEILTEPTPSRDRRRAILAFEATEGGAGVLGRLATEREAVARVARAALELMHFEPPSIDAAIAAADPSLLVDRPESHCVKGCYRCLLSYYNQPDHELIDRTDVDVRLVLLRLARGTVEPAGKAPPSGLSESGWPAAFAIWRLPPTDPEALSVGGIVLPYVWRSHLVAATTQALNVEDRSAAEALGYAIAVLPEVPGTAPPADLLSLLGVEP